MTRPPFNPETFRRAGAAWRDRLRILRTPDPDSQQAAEINRIAAAMAVRRLLRDSP